MNKRTAFFTNDFFLLDEDGKIVGKLTKNAGCHIYKIEDGWAKIITPQGEHGYMMTQFLKAAEETMEARLSALEARVLKLERGE